MFTIVSFDSKFIFSFNNLVNGMHLASVVFDSFID